MRAARLFAAVCALLFLLAHLPFLAPTLEDIDSVNFALGLREFDVAAHRPHPPGYPVFIALGKVARMAVAAVSPGLSPDALDARTLALLGVVFGALLAWPLLQVFRMLEQDDGRARAALLVTLCAPLLWFTASRPLSDLAGLFAATVAQALLLTAWRRQRSQAEARAADRTTAVDREGLAASGRLIVLGAFAAGLAIGVRSQTLWLTVPVLLAVIADRAGRGAAGAILGASVTFGAGALVWVVPLVSLTGGPRAYLTAVSSQAGEDLSGVDMLATNPTGRRLLAGLAHTFLDPWESWWLGGVVLVLAACGAVAMLRRSRPALGMLIAMSLPYAVFHLAFHETFTTRYALPLLPAVAYIAVRGVAALSARLTPVAAAGLAVAGLVLTMGPLAAYARTGSPLARALDDVRAKATACAAPAVLMLNHSFSIALRYETLPLPRLPTVTRRQWLEAVRYWRQGGDLPVWFLADPGPNGLDRRHELSLLDPAARRLARTYRWPFGTRSLLGGARPSNLDWFVIDPPGWFAGQGWALTPDVAGMSDRDGKGPALGGAPAWVRRRPGAATVLVGGRNLGTGDAPDVRFDLSVDGRSARAWRVPPDPGFFLEIFTLEAGALVGTGPYAELTITAEAADGSRRAVDAAIEQFDLQPTSAVVFGFDLGWYEHEYSPAQDRLWRWTREAATLRIAGPARPLVCRIRGESPLRYFDRPPNVRLRAGARLLATLQPASDFTWEVPVPADALAAAGGTLTLETDETFVPHDRGASGDRRALGLRIYAVDLVAAGEVAR